MSDYETLVERVRLKCTECGDCWVWTGALGRCEQPTMRVNGRRTPPRPVRRILLEARGVDMKGKLATVSCETRTCVAPHHLTAMTRRALVKRSVVRTQYHKRVDRCAKLAARKREAGRSLPQEVVDKVRASASAAAAAKEVGISRSTAIAIRAWRTHKDYTNPFAAILCGAST